MAGGRGIPGWVMSMLEAKFTIVKQKGKKAVNRKYMCVSCSSGALTEFEKQTHHHDHYVLEAFCCSRSFAYRKDDIDDLISRLTDKSELDVSNVAVYEVNGKEFYYPSSRVYENYAYGGGRSCRYCGWRLADKAGLFCSMLCGLKFNHPRQDRHPSVEGGAIMDRAHIDLGGEGEEEERSEEEEAKKNETNIIGGETSSGELRLLWFTILA